jgi:histidinol-phosphate aminotransferase
MRLHLNENTAGCSPAVIEVLQRIGREDVGIYPDYDAAYTAVAGYFGVHRESLLLTNGMDEGILASAGAAFRGRADGVPEAIGVVPAFDEYGMFVTALGGRMVTVPMPDDFTLPADAIASRVTPRTRILFLTSPHNPSGVPVPRQVLVDLARRLTTMLVFVDEAYVDFGGETLLDQALLDEVPNLIVGRTFSKAYGLAGLRCGALVANAATLEPIRRIVPVFSLNTYAAAALPAAVADVAYRDWYVQQTRQSRRLLTGACERLGLRTWPSAANFVLIHIGPQVKSVIEALGRLGIRVRDRSNEPGCGGCLRITAGRVDETTRAIAALEQVLCDAR